MAARTIAPTTPRVYDSFVALHAKSVRSACRLGRQSANAM